MNYIDFIIGALLMNAMPHLIFGLTNTHFLGLFGYSAKGNIIYATLQLILCLVLFSFNYGYEKLLNNGYLLGGLFVLISYFALGKVLVKVYGSKKTPVDN